jgi:hypothetical protein
MLLRQRNHDVHGTTVHMTIGPAGSSSSLNPTMYGTTSNRRKIRGGRTYVADEEEESDLDYEEEEDDLDYEEEEEIPDTDDGSDAENNPTMVDAKGFANWEDDFMVRNDPD